MAVQTSQSRSIKEMFGNIKSPQPRPFLSPTAAEVQAQICLKASQDLEDLLKHSTKQTAAYQNIIPITSNWYRRH